MKAIETRFLGATNRRGSRIVASDSDGNRVTVSYDHSARNPHMDAAVALCRKMGWVGTLAGGSLKRGQVFVFIDSADLYKVV